MIFTPEQVAQLTFDADVHNEYGVEILFNGDQAHLNLDELTKIINYAVAKALEKTK